MSFLFQVQDLSWADSARPFDTEAEMWLSQPNYEHEVAYARDTKGKFQGVRPEVGGWGFASGAPGPTPPIPPGEENVLDRAGEDILDRFGQNIVSR
jgi:hypothetical protein